MSFVFYNSTNNPTGLSGTVGGTADTNTPLSGYLGELFTHVFSPPSGLNISGAFQYRKVSVKNGHSSTSRETRAWLDAVEHSGQVSIALEASTNQTSTSPTGEPSNVTTWSSAADYNSGLELGNMLAGSISGIWIRQELSGIQSPDPYASFTIVVGGLVS